MRGRPPRRPLVAAEHPLIAEAVRLHQTGKLAEAAGVYEQILTQVPRHFDATHLLGVIALQVERYEEAERRIKAALQWNPDDAAALGNLGTVYLRTGRLDAAHRQFERTVRLQPDAEAPLTNLGTVLRQMGRSQDALVPLQHAYQKNPGSANVCNLVGACLLDTGDARAAARMFEAATVAEPDNVDGWANLAAAIARTGDGDAALQIANKAIAMQPGSSSARAVLGAALLEKGNVAAAIAAYREAANLPSPSTQTLCAFGSALMRSGFCDEARKVFAQAIDIDANNPNARWAAAMAWCEPIFASADEIGPARTAFDQSLDGLRKWFDTARRADAHTVVGSNQPFFLAYQPYCNRELLGRYGNLCVDWMASLPMGKTIAANKRRDTNDQRLRVGFVSAHIRDHSVWNAITKGWVLHFDKEKVATHLFQLDHHSDRETELARQHAAAFVDQPNSLHGWTEAIRAANLDVLVYPEIGMDPLTAQLASLRLAPVQAAAWGHPETTGLPTMDLYLSAQDFEPDRAEQNYTETLIRLPGFGVYVEPLAPEVPEFDLREFGLPRDEPLLLCPGAPFKYSPLHDAVWARIARGLHAGDGGWLVFFRSRSESMDSLLERRLRLAFEREQVDYDAHVCLIPTLSRPRFYALMQRSALMLDTVGFSGFNTALQAVECGLPVLAHEGEFMRGRLASAIMRRLQLPELVATTDEEFIMKAVQLAGDTTARSALAGRIVNRREQLVGDVAPVRALEGYLGEAAKKARR